MPSFLYHCGQSCDELWRADTFFKRWFILSLVSIVGFLGPRYLLLELYAVFYGGCAPPHLPFYQPLTRSPLKKKTCYHYCHFWVFFLLAFLKLTYNIINRFPFLYSISTGCLFTDLPPFSPSLLVIAIFPGAKLL